MTTRAEPLHLGRALDHDSLETTSDPHILDVDALTRHAVVFGATGSGKTGLAVVMIEELIRAGVPIIAVDPKGDLANLALLFERLEPSSFAPFMEEPEKAESLAETWRGGLASAGIDEQELADIAGRVDLQILTPGSRAAAPVDVLGALASPGLDPDDEDGWVEALRATVHALLELIGVRADPVQDPRHVVLSHLLDHLWREGQSPSLESLVVQLVDPPFSKVGAFPLNTFLPRKERMDLAMKLNGLLASPSFKAWSVGTPLDVEALLAPSPGKVPVRVFYMAHLSEAERQLAATLLLTRLAGWSRRQPGSSKLRAVLLFDEAWGYMPPHPHDPSTKRPLLQLLKQARAVGLGVVLATQNPVDLDYKALSNAGTWLVGRLATRQDRDRVLDGADAQVRTWLDDMPKRGFWVRRPGAAPDSLLTTRWAMTWLRGPLTLPEVTKIVGDPNVDHDEGEDSTGGPAGTWLPSPPPSSGLTVRYLDPETAHSPRLKPLLAGREVRPGANGSTHWEPALLARLHVRFDERGWEAEREELRWVFPLDGAVHEPELTEGDLFSATPEGQFSTIGVDLSDRALKSLGKTIIDDVVRDEVQPFYRHATTKLMSRSAETREEFEARVQAALEALADEDIRKEQANVEKAVSKLERKREDLEASLSEQQADAQSRWTTEIVNAGETLFGMLLGGRRKSWSTMASRRRMTQKANAKADRTEQKIDDLNQEIEEAATELEEKLGAIRQKHLDKLGDIDEKEVRLERDDVSLLGFELVWVPVSTAI